MAISERSVERKAELQAFERTLAGPASKPRVHFIYGPGGIGKTWLVQEMLSLAQHWGCYVTNPAIDMYATKHRHIEGVIETVVERLRQQVGSGLFAKVEEERTALERLRSNVWPRPSEEEIQSRLRTLTQAFRDSLGKIVGDTSVVLAFDTFEHVQDSEVGKWVLGENGLQMGGVVCIVASRTEDGRGQGHKLTGLTDNEALDLYYRYTNTTDARHDRTIENLVKELNAKAHGNPLLLGLALQLPNRLQRSDELSHISYEEFQKQIVWSLHSVQGGGLRNLGGLDMDEPMYQTLVCMSYLNRRFNRFFLERLVERGYVRLGATTQDQIWDQLQRPHFFFVKERPDDEIQLHDILAELVREYLLSDAILDPQRFMSDVVTWYNELIKESPSNAQDLLRVEMLAYGLRLDAPLQYRQPGYEQVVPLVQSFGRMRSDVLDRLVVNVMSVQAIARLRLPGPPTVAEYEFWRSLGQLTHRAHYLDESKNYWGQAVVLARRLNDSRRQVEALVGLHDSTWESEPYQSMAYLEQAFDLCNNVEELRARVMYEIGFTHRQTQNLLEALSWYERAIQSCRTDESLLPTILNDMGYAYLLIGEAANARVHIEEARRLRQLNLDDKCLRLEESDREEQTEEEMERKSLLEDQRYLAALQLGMTLNTMGEMERLLDDLAAAEASYSAALSCFENEKSFFWQARALFSRGETFRRLAAKRYAKGQADYVDYEEKAKIDLVESLNLCDRFDFRVIGSTAHRRAGRLLHDRAQRAKDRKEQLHLLAQAKSQFEQGLEIACLVGDTLEELENLTELAFLVDDRLAAMSVNRSRSMNDSEASDGHREIDRLRLSIENHRYDSPRIFQFEVFQHLLELELGAFNFELRQYDRSLEYYLIGFTGLASDPGYGRARYQQHIDHLFRNLGRLDSKTQEYWCNCFIERLKTTELKRGMSVTLDKAYPELVKRFELRITASQMSSQSESEN